MKDLLELDSRREIYELVEDQPGVHLSKIADLLEMNVSLAEYHLRFLEKNDLIKSVKKKGYKRYFPTKEKVEPKDKEILFELRKEIPLTIVFLLIENGRMTHKKILKEMDIAKSTLSYHLRKLKDIDILKSKKYGKKRGYSLRDRKEVVQLLVKYKPQDVIDGFADIWKDLQI
ncbi:MAG: winged helix-turn-helix transcriptional regulator [Thermoplasmata archaeon]